MQRWNEVIVGYLAACQARGVGEETRKAIRSELERFGRWIREREPGMKMEEVDAERIVNYVRSRGVCRAKATVSGVMSKLRCLGEWLVLEGYWKKSPLTWLKGPKLSPYSQAPMRVSQMSMKKLWEGAATSTTEYKQKQWLCVLALLYGLGLRRGEVARLNVEDWQPGEGLLRVEARKTGRQLSLPMIELVARCMEAYWPERQSQLEKLGKSDEKAMFVNREGERLSGPALGNGIFRIAKRMEVPLTRLHQFRHTCASDLIEAGVRMPEVQRILGHASVSSTVRYLHYSDPQRKEAVAKHPINEMLMRNGGAV